MGAMTPGIFTSVADFALGFFFGAAMFVVSFFVALRDIEKRQKREAKPWASITVPNEAGEWSHSSDEP